MSTYTVRRILEAFFRRWWLYMLPVVALSSLGAFSVLASGSTYFSAATLTVADSTLLSTLSDVRANPNYGYESPAEATSRRFNALLQTESFAAAVAKSAGLSSALTSGEVTLADVRRSVYAAPAGTNLLRVGASTREPSAAPQLVTAAIDEFVKLVVGSETSDSKAAESFYGELAVEYKVDVDKATQELDAFLAANPAVGPEAERPEASRLELARLNEQLTRAEARYESVRGKSLDAQLATKQSEADVGQRLTVVDEPQDAVLAGSLRQSVMSFAPWVVLGFLVAGVAVVGAAMLDNSVRTPLQVQERLGLRSLAFLPQVDPVRIREVRMNSAPLPSTSRSSSPAPAPPSQTATSPDQTQRSSVAADSSAQPLVPAATLPGPT